MKKIIIVSYGGGHINMLLPVIKKLQSYKNLELLIIGLTTAGIILEKHNIPHIGFKDLLSSDDEDALEIGKSLSPPPDLNSIVSYEESVAYMGLSYKDLELHHGKKKAKKMYDNGGRQAFYPISVMERVLKKESPDLVLTTNSPRAERAAITAAGKLNIPSICLIDLFGKQEIKWIGNAKYAQKICVLSNHVKESLLRLGRYSDEIVVTGNPVFDGLVYYKENSQIFYKNRRWNRNKKVILWASQPEPTLHPFTNEIGDPDLPRKVERELLRIISRNTEWHLIIRPHPNESISYKNLPCNAELSTSRELLYELVSTVDVVITMSSTVGLEAALLEKPVISVDLSIFTKDAPYSKMGISKGITCLHLMEETLLSVFSGAWSPKVKLPKVGRATNKVVSTILSLLQ